MTDDDPHYPAHREWVDVVDPGEEMGSGVRHDAVMEAAIEAEAAAEHLQDMAVTLDGLADDRGLYPRSVRRDMREAQERTQGLASWLEAFSAALRKRQEEVRDE